MIQDKVSLEKAYQKIKEYWSPITLGRVDNYEVKIAKIKGEFPWHTHKNEDEFFYVVKGGMVIRMRDRNILLNEGEFFVVPKGIEHSTASDDETWIMMFEASNTQQYGDSK